MFLTTFLSSIYLLSAQVEAPKDPVVLEAIEIVNTHHLGTADGRVAFLTDQLTPFVTQADQLNREIQALALQVSSIEIPEETQSEEQKKEMIALGEELNQKMSQMIEMLPTLQTALLIDQDFAEIDAILAKEGTLNQEEKDLLLRISSLCNFLDVQNSIGE